MPSPVGRWVTFACLAASARRLGQELGLDDTVLLRLLAADLPKIIVTGSGHLDVTR